MNWVAEMAGSSVDWMVGSTVYKMAVQWVVEMVVLMAGSSVALLVAWMEHYSAE